MRLPDELEQEIRREVDRQATVMLTRLHALTDSVEQRIAYLETERAKLRPPDDTEPWLRLPSGTWCRQRAYDALITLQRTGHTVAVDTATGAVHVEPMPSADLYNRVSAPWRCVATILAEQREAAITE